MAKGSYFEGHVFRAPHTVYYLLKDYLVSLSYSAVDISVVVSFSIRQ